MSDSGDRFGFHFPTAYGAKYSHSTLFGTSRFFYYYPFRVSRNGVRKRGEYLDFHKETLTFIVCEVVSAYVAMPILVSVAVFGTSRVFFFDFSQLMLYASKFVIINGFYFATYRASTFCITVFRIARRDKVPVAVTMVGYNGDVSRLSPIAAVRCALFNYHTVSERYGVICGTVVIELPASADGSALIGVAICNNVAAVDDDVSACRAVRFTRVCAAAYTCGESRGILFSSAADCGDETAVDDRRAAGTRLTTAYTCGVVTAASVDYATVYGNIACRLAIVTADTGSSVGARGFEYAHSIFIERLSVNCKARTARNVDTFECVYGHTV